MKKIRKVWRTFTDLSRWADWSTVATNITFDSDRFEEGEPSPLVAGLDSSFLTVDDRVETEQIESLLDCLAHGALDLLDRKRLADHVVDERIESVRALALVGIAGHQQDRQVGPRLPDTPAEVEA